MFLDRFEIGDDRPTSCASKANGACPDVRQTDLPPSFCKSLDRIPARERSKRRRFRMRASPAVPVAWQRAQFLVSRASPRFTGALLSCADNGGTAPMMTTARKDASTGLRRMAR